MLLHVYKEFAIIYDYHSYGVVPIPPGNFHSSPHPTPMVVLCPLPRLLLPLNTRGKLECGVITSTKSRGTVYCL